MRETDVEQEIKWLIEDVRRRVRHAPAPKRISTVIGRLLARQGYGAEKTAAISLDAWREAVGAQLAADTRPGNVQRGQLQIVVRDSATVQELTFRRAELLKRMQQALPERRIRGLKFRVGPID